MVPIVQLWIPILVSAVVVFVASSILHMVFTYHRREFHQLPNEDKLLAALREVGLKPGQYNFPWCGNPKEMGTPEMAEKYKTGPVGLMMVIPNGPPAMGKYLTQWFLFCVGIGVIVAYLTGRTISPGASYLAVFRVAGTTAYLGYAAANIANGIWKGQTWSLTLKEQVDGLVYALLTAGVFGWLWPR